MAYCNARTKEERERLRGEEYQIEFADFRFERRQVKGSWKEGEK